MKFKFILLLFPLLLTSCTKDASSRVVYLAAKYKLKYASVISGYTIDSTPYFKYIPNQTSFVSEFDLDKSIFNLETKIDNFGNPYGTGNFEIHFKNTSIEPLVSNFTYNCSYGGVYGGKVLISEDTRPTYLGEILYRTRNWWIRCEASLPQIVDEKLILQFEFLEMNEEPKEFDHKIW